MLSLRYCLLFSLFCQKSLSSVSISNGVYNGISVGLDSSFRETECEGIVQAVVSMFEQASGVLNEATSGLTFGSISVVVPASWSRCGSYSVNAADGYMTYDTSNIKVGQVHPIFGREPWTQQPRGCGLPGDFISMSSSWLLTTNDQLKGSRLVHEWAKYRWGVFEEYGHFEDHAFPESIRQFDGTWTPNYCSDKPLNGGFTSSCTDSSDCEFVLHNSSDVSSSLLAVPQLLSVTNFCTDSNHVVSIPTKQNLLCNYRSTWDVIKRHSDITDNTFAYDNLRRGEARAVEVKVLRENLFTSIVIAYEVSNVMEDEINRFEFQKESLAQFIVYEAPSSAQVGLVAVSNTPVTQSNLMSLQDDTNRLNLANKIIGTSTTDDASINLKLALQNSADLLPDGNGIIILVTKCTNLDPSFTPEELASAADGHPVWILLYPITDITYLSTFTSLASLTGGNIAIVEEDIVTDQSGAYVSPNTRLKLSEVLRQPLHLHPEFDIQQADYTTCESSEITCTRNLELAKGFDTTVFLYFYFDEGDKIDYTEVSVSGSETCQPQEFDGAELMTTNVMICQVENTGADLTVEVTRQRSNAIMIMELVGKPLYEESDFGFTLSGSSYLFDLKYSNDSAPAIYTQVTYNGTRIVYASISAEVSFGLTKSTYDDIFLRDDGTGADVTGNDGIYSAFLLPQIPKGDFSLSLFANDNSGSARLLPDKQIASLNYMCCGSIIPLPANLRQVPTFSLSKTTLSGTITVSPDFLNLPPGTIKDFKVTDASSTVISLQFTATGEDLDYGTADHYVITQYFDNKNGSTILNYTPKESGSVEVIIVDSLNIECGKQRSLLIYAVDAPEDGLRGNDSNQAPIFIPCSNNKPPEGLTAGAMTGIIIACIFLLIVIIVILYMIYRENTDKDNRGKHMKIKGCSCCENNDKNDEFYNKTPSSRLEISPVEKIRSIDDLVDNYHLRNTNQENHNVGSSSQIPAQENGFKIDGKTERTPDDSEGYATDTFQYPGRIQKYDSEISLSSSIPPSSLVASTHSINQIGVPVTPSSTYSQRGTIPMNGRSLESLHEPPPVPPKPKKYVLTSQV